MSIFKQKRQTDRKSLIYYLETSDQKTGRFIGRTVDITTEGFRLISEEIVEAGKDYQLSIHLPEEIQGSELVSIDTRCLHSERDPNSRYYYSGFKFKTLEPVSKAIIDKLIAQYEF